MDDNHDIERLRITVTKLSDMLAAATLQIALLQAECDMRGDEITRLKHEGKEDADGDDR